jgi:predicted DNA binding CopG/RHH family protein
MPKKLKKIPKFKNEDEEAEFWNTHDSTEYLDWSKAIVGINLFPNLKPSSRSISLRLPAYIIDAVKVQANKIDVPYQALMKQYIATGAGVLQETPRSKYK